MKIKDPEAPVGYAFKYTLLNTTENVLEREMLTLSKFRPYIVYKNKITVSAI